jgi:hypothetical protein
MEEKVNVGCKKEILLKLLCNLKNTHITQVHASLFALILSLKQMKNLFKLKVRIYSFFISEDFELSSQG